VGDVGTIYESDKLSLKSKSRGEFSVSERFETADINELNNYKSGRIYSTKWTGSAKAAESIEKKLLNEGFEVNVKVASTNSRYIEFYRESDQKEGVIRVSGHGRIGDITLDTRTREAVSKTGKPYEFKEVFFTVNSDIDFDNDFFEANVMTSKSFEATKEALDNFISAPKSKSSREWVEDVQLEVRAKLQDRMVRVLKIQEDIQSYIGGTVPLNFDFKNAEARLPGVVRDLQDKTMEKAEEIIKLFSSEGLNPEQFGDLLYALHAQERNKAVRIRTTDVPMSLRTLRNMFDLTPTQAAKNAGVSVDVYKSIEAGGTFTEQELNDIVDSYGMTTDEFFREFTRNNEGSGMSDLEAREILSNYGVKNLDNPLASMLPAKLAKAVSMSHEINQQTRGLLVSSGLETREIVDAYEYAYDNYVPLRGFVPEEDGDEVEVFVEGGKRLPVRGKIKRAMGRYSKSDDPFTQLIAQNFNVIARAKKNEAMQKLYNLTDDVKNPEVYKAVNTSRDVKYKEQFINGKQVRVPVPPRDYANNPNYVPVRFNGIDRFIKFEDPRMVEALNGMNVQQTNAIFSVFKTINRAMTATITVYDPEFVLRNFSRDIQMSLINVMAEQELVDGLAAGEKIIGNTMKGVPKSFKAIFDAQRGNENTTKYAKYYNEFLEDGGQIETFYGSTSKEVGESVKSLFDKENRDQSGRLVRLKESTMKASFGLIKDINSSVENAIRLSAYIAAREAGVSREKAAELGKKVTVDFNRTGEYGQFMNSLYLFFNASIQGSSRLIRTLKPVKVDGKLVVTRPQKIALGLMAFAGILSLVNAAISGDDEEDGKSWYSKIPDYEKERNMIFMNPFDKQGKDYFKIPLPYGLNIFYVLGNSIADVSLGENKLAEAFTNVALSIVSNFSPIGFPTSENPEKRLLKMITPSVFQPIAGIALNEDFTGRPVYSENLPFDKTPLPDSELGKKAGPAATNLAKTLNEATGGSQVRSGSTDVNPDVLEYILNYYTGGVGKTSSRVGKLAYAGINGELKDVKPNDIPLARVFYGTAYDRVDYTGFYKKISNVYQLNEEIKLGLRSGSEAKKIQVTLAEAKAVDKRLRNIRKAEKEGRINEDKAEDMRTDLMKNFLRDYDKRKIDDI
jgi:DNA-binding XRE family transcriptional regulator